MPLRTADAATCPTREVTVSPPASCPETRREAGHADCGACDSRLASDPR